MPFAICSKRERGKVVIEELCATKMVFVNCYGLWRLVCWDWRARLKCFFEFLVLFVVW